MSRWSAYGKLDSRLLEDGDAKFIGVDMTRDRALLGPGMLAEAVNKRLRDGAAATRPGNVQPPDFAAPFTNTLIGSGIYSNPNGDELMLVAEAGAAFVWGLQDGKDPIKINLAAGQTCPAAGGSVEFVQAFDKVELLRKPGIALSALIWDGTAGHTFDVVTLPAGAIKIIPPNNLSPGIPGYTACNTHGEPFQDRVLYYNAQDPALPWSYQFIASDVIQPTAYDPPNRTFNVNAGEAGWITRIWPYFDSSAVVFKKRTIHQFYDFAGPDPTLATRRQLSKTRGLCAPRAIVESGSDLLFLDEPAGIYKLNQVIQNQVATEPYPVSDNIQPLINRINWPSARKWAGAVPLKEYAYFGLPLDPWPISVTGNNVIVVYNTVTSQWESGFDYIADSTCRIHALHVTNYQNGRAVFGLDYTNKKVYALYQSSLPQDQVNDVQIPIIDAIETRGYTCGDPHSFKRYSRALASLRTVNPLVTVSAISDGFNEIKTLNPTPLTKDRAKFYPHGHDDFGPATGDPNEPRREDYSQASLLDNFVGEDFELVPIGPVSEIPGSADPGGGPLQESREPFSVRVNARWISLRIENHNGVCDVLAAGVEATASLMETKTAA
jgi:hypothetical protein